MSFEAKISDHIKTLEKKGKDLYFERDKLLHRCDCSYCEYGDVEDGNEEKWDQLTAEMKEVEDTISRVKQHAKLHKIEVPV